MKYFVAGFVGTVMVMLAFVRAVYFSPLREHVDLMTVRITDAKREQLATCHDVYLVGDSSGNGIDYEYISNQTHKDVVTVALTGFAGRAAYQSVISHIDRQKCHAPIVVLYLAARDILYDTGTDGSLDGFYVTAAFSGIPGTLGYFLHYPITLPRIALSTLGAFTMSRHDFRKPEYFNTATRHDIDNNIGQDCKIEHIIDAVEPGRYSAYVRHLKAAFPKIRFILVAAPVPRCTSNAQVINQVDSLVDYGVEYMPNTYFRDYTHLGKDGVKPASERVVKILKDYQETISGEAPHP